MVLVLQIIVLLLILVGLITIIMSIKNWHWAQMVLLLSIFFVSILDLVMGLEVYRIHRNFRKPMPAKEQLLADTQARIRAIDRGTREAALITKIYPDGPPFDLEAEGRMPAIDVWKQRLQMLARQRGRVWTNVKPAPRLDAATGQIAVSIPAPRPLGLEKEAIVYLFEQPPAGAPAAGPPMQYLGEFRVGDVREDGATLRSVQGLDQRTGARLAQSAASGRLWKLYETMPTDSHELFAGLSEEQLKQLLPKSSVGEYLRHGTPATADDDANHRAGFDEEGRRVGPDDEAKAVKKLYDRPLRDYAYLFAELIRERVVMISERAGLIEDVNRLKVAHESALQLKTHREQEIASLTIDLKQMKRDRAVIERLLATVQQQLASARQQVADLLQHNADEAAKLIESQLAQLRAITTATTPAANPAPAVLANPQ